MSSDATKVKAIKHILRDLKPLQELPGYEHLVYSIVNDRFPDLEQCVALLEGTRQVTTEQLKPNHVVSLNRIFGFVSNSWIKVNELSRVIVE